MTIIRKVMPAQTTVVGENEVLVVISTDKQARDEHIFMPAGAQLENYRKNPVVLWSHDDEEPPIGRGEDVTVNDHEITARVIFPDAGISPEADKIRGLVKANFIHSVSVGMDPIETEPLDPKKPRGGQRVLKWELLEFSFCNVPVDTGSSVIARAKRHDDWKVGASRTLPLDPNDSVWDAMAAASSIFEWAGGDNFDPARARKGFLVFNAAKPKERASYQWPIAHAVDGRLQVPKGAIRAVLSRQRRGEEPASKSAQGVIDHYKELAGMSKNSDGDRGLQAKHTRALELAPAVPVFKRGLYDLAQFCYLLQQAKYLHDSAEYEAALEEDESEVPAMIAEGVLKFGEALKNMAVEEVTELLAEMAGGEDDEVAEIETRDLPEGERAFIAAAKTPRARAWRRGIAMLRAGKILSASNEKKITEAQGHCERALKHTRALAEHNDAVGEQLDGCRALHEKASKANATVGEALTAAKDEPEKAPAHIARALKAHKAVDGHLGDLAEAHTDATDRSQDVGDAHNGIGRSVKSAQRCMRSVVEGSTPGGEDSDSKEVQTSGGTEEDTGSSRSHDPDFRRRQAEVRSLMDIAALV
jgi:hypothetical protein